MNKDCPHNKLCRGLISATGEFYTFCYDCSEKWYDGGKRWEELHKLECSLCGANFLRSKIKHETYKSTILGRCPECNEVIEANESKR